jgi:hypothetical protein
VVYVKPISAAKLSQFMDEDEFSGAEDYQIVVAADGSPLLVADSEEAVEEWLADRNYGIALLH